VRPQPSTTTRKRVRVYELYRGPGGGFSNNSQNYALYGRCTVHVAARSIKEAYFLANRGRWRDAISTVGIVEQYDGVAWTREDGSQSEGPRYHHGGSAQRMS
jgi:hypothetical protein